MDPAIILIIQVIIWIGCGVIGAKLMKQKKRSEAIGAILGVILGLIGLLIILFIPENKTIDYDMVEEPVVEKVEEN